MTSDDAILITGAVCTANCPGRASEAVIRLISWQLQLNKGLRITCRLQALLNADRGCYKNAAWHAFDKCCNDLICCLDFASLDQVFFFAPKMCSFNLKLMVLILQAAAIVSLLINELYNRVGHFCNSFFYFRSPGIFWCHGTQ